MALQISNKISQDQCACALLCYRQLHNKKAAQRPEHGQVIRGIHPPGITTQQCHLQRSHPRSGQSNCNLRCKEGKVAHRPGLKPMLAMLRHMARGPVLPAWLPGGARFTHCPNNQGCDLFIHLCMLRTYNFTCVGCCMGILTGSCTVLLLSEMGRGMRLSELCYYEGRCVIFITLLQMVFSLQKSETRK